MIALCFLPARSLTQIQRALPPPNHVLNAGTWDEIISQVRERQCDIAIVDPCEGGDHLTSNRVDALAAASAHQAVAIVGYLPITAAGMRAVQRLAQLGAQEILIRGVDDTPDGLTATIHRAVAELVAARVVADLEVSPPFRALPTNVASALELVFRRPEQVRSVGALATAAKTTRRSLDRCLARAGLSPARALLSCARANAAYHLLAGGSVRKARVASLVGCASTRSLARELHAVTGYPASAIPARLARDDFAAVLRQRLVRSASPPVAISGPY
jgi:hypothetical protein